MIVASERVIQSCSKAPIPTPRKIKIEARMKNSWTINLEIMDQVFVQEVYIPKKELIRYHPSKSSALIEFGRSIAEPQSKCPRREKGSRLLTDVDS